MYLCCEIIGCEIMVLVTTANLCLKWKTKLWFSNLSLLCDNLITPWVLSFFLFELKNTLLKKHTFYVCFSSGQLDDILKGIICGGS